MPIKNNTDGLMDEMDKRIKEKLLKSALIVERDAKKNCPRKTGRLVRSITHVIEGNKAVVGTNVEYAPYVELGTHKMAARPFLRNALHGNIRKIKRIWNDK